MGVEIVVAVVTGVKIVVTVDMGVEIVVTVVTGVKIVVTVDMGVRFVVTVVTAGRADGSWRWERRAAGAAAGNWVVML
jgi:hypothetical protein